jgi:hypothetical protein
MLTSIQSECQKKIVVEEEYDDEKEKEQVTEEQKDLSTSKIDQIETVDSNKSIRG